MITETKKMHGTKTTYVEFDCMQDVHNFIKKNMDYLKQAGDYVTDNALKNDSDRRKFRGGMTSNQYLHALKFGDVESLKKYEKAAANAAYETEKARPLVEMVNDVAGAYVDMGIYMQGAPECMVDFRQSEAIKFVDINLCLVASGFTDAEILWLKNIYAIKMVDYLENNGYRCRVQYVCPCKPSRDAGTTNRIMYTIQLKDYHDHLDLSALLFAAHPAMLRGVVFLLNAIYMREKVIHFSRAGYCYPEDSMVQERYPDAVNIRSLYDSEESGFTFLKNFSNFSRYLKRYLHELD